MTTIAGASFNPQAIRKFQNALDAELQSVVRQIQGLLVSSATLSKPDGKGGQIYVIPQTSEQYVLSRAGDLIQRFFVGPDLRHPFGSDGVTPLAPYPRILNDHLAWVSYKVVEKHAEYLKKKLPDDIHRWLMNRLAREQVDPLANYTAPHEWVDGKNRRLSDRIWQASIETRRKIDAFLTDGIRTGRGALDMSKDLEAFLLPNRKGLTTDKPYGTNASFDAMRLGRSEITRAWGQTTQATSAANPFVDGMDWKTSTSHPKFDECDKLATIDSNGKRVKEPYPVESCPIPGVETHPQCLCIIFAWLASSAADVINQLRQAMQSGQVAPLTPVDSFSFLKVLLGSYLASLVFKQIAGTLK